MILNKKIYTTADFLISTYLYSKGHHLVEIDWVSTSRAEFLFEHTESLKEDISKYWNGEAFVDAKALLQAQRELKQRLYGSK